MCRISVGALINAMQTDIQSGTSRCGLTYCQPEVSLTKWGIDGYNMSKMGFAFLGLRVKGFWNLGHTRNLGHAGGADNLGSAEGWRWVRARGKAGRGNGIDTVTGP